MNNFNKFVIVVIIAIIAIVVITSVSVKKTTPDSMNVGSVAQSGEYQATTTQFMSAGLKPIQVGQSVLGSIVIASTSSSGTFTIWNATSTIDISSTTVAQFTANPTVGTYTFDINMTRGIFVQLGAGFNGSYTITYR